VGTSDTESIIRRGSGHSISLSGDILKPSADSFGSFSLAEKARVLSAASCRLHRLQIAEVLNHDLMRTLYEVNGWSLDNLPKFVYADIERLAWRISQSYSTNLPRPR
jgi:hypothetical protein